MTLNEISAVLSSLFPDILIVYEATPDKLVGVPEIIPVESEISIPLGKSGVYGKFNSSITWIH